MILARARARRQAIEENIASNRSTFVVIPKPKDCGKSLGYFMDFILIYFPYFNYDFRQCKRFEKAYLVKPALRSQP